MVNSPIIPINLISGWKVITLHFCAIGLSDFTFQIEADKSVRVHACVTFFHII